MRHRTGLIYYKSFIKRGRKSSTFIDQPIDKRFFKSWTFVENITYIVSSLALSIVVIIHSVSYSIINKEVYMDLRKTLFLLVAAVMLISMGAASQSMDIYTIGAF